MLMKGEKTAGTAQRVLDMVQFHYDIGLVTQVSPLEGGEWKTIFRVDSMRGSFVLSIYHPSTTAGSVIYEHSLLHYLHSRIAQVPAPITGYDGSTYFIEDNRIVSIFPLMPGAMADRSTARLAAARFLAKFHSIALEYPNHSPRPSVPAWREWDWGEQEWSSVEVLLSSQPDTATGVAQRFWREGGKWVAQIVARRTQILQERLYLQQWLTALSCSKRPLRWGPIHDDYYRNNLLMDGEEISALLDWDGCHPDWLILDVSTALWEFCLEEPAHTLNTAHAQAFLDAYCAAEGPVTAEEFDLIVPLIRVRRMIEVISALQGIVTGEEWNEGHAEYLVHNLISLENLRNCLKRSQRGKTTEHQADHDDS
jgi:homoserine kinase type II